MKKIRFVNIPKIRIIWPKVNLPKISLPQVRWPRLVLPNLALPKVNLPKIVLPKIRIEKPALPKIYLPQLTLPRVSVPKISLPKVALPKLPRPQISLAELKWPSIKLPTIQKPKLPALPPLPKFERPKVTLPKITLPQMDVPKMSGEHLKIIAGMVACLIIFTALHTGLGTDSGVWASSMSKLEQVKNAAFLKVAKSDAAYDLNAIAPASGDAQDDGVTLAQGSSGDEERGQGNRYDVEEDVINVEAVLIPRENTVISSSQDGKIKEIYFDNGETFKKGDILVEYACEDLRAEVEIAKSQKELAEKKNTASYKLFKLDIISDIEKLELETETQEAKARADIYESRMRDCFIRAEYDGRVIKRLANAAEFTRTDRVLMEVASLDYLKAEFLLPSRWLRWVNVGAPLSIEINETDKTYQGEIKFIYGEVDPVSQSIQVTAQLAPYEDRLLPGMSGQATIDVGEIRERGIYGFLERPPEGDSDKGS